MTVSGITAAPYHLYVIGNAYSTGSFISSDRKLKSEIKEIDNSHSILNNIEGYTYTYKPKHELLASAKSTKIVGSDTIYVLNDTGERIVDNVVNTSYYNDMPEGRKYGLLAQEVKEIVPELVQYDTASGLYAVNYDGFIPILIEGYKELSQKVEELQDEVNKFQKNKDNEWDSKNKALMVDEMSSNKGLYLGGNIPNPFNEETLIAYYIPQDVIKAQFLVYDLRGNQLYSETIYERGEGEITISAGNFKPGIYLYTIIVDGLLADTKQMVLTEN